MKEPALARSWEHKYGSGVSKGTRVLGDDVAKGVTRQGVAPVLARVNPNRSARRVVHDPRKVVGKAMPSLKPLSGLRQPGGMKGIGTGLMSGLRQGRAGAGATALSSPASAGGRMGMTAGRAIGANPGKAGLLGGAAGATALTAGNGMNNRYKPQAPMMGGGLYGGFGKRSYDPEGERRFRQGAAAATTGVGALEVGRRAVRTVRQDSAHTRDLVGRKGSTPKNAQAAQLQEKARVARLKSIRGATVSRKAALQGLGALGLTGTSGALLRNRNEPRWD